MFISFAFTRVFSSFLLRPLFLSLRFPFSLCFSYLRSCSAFHFSFFPFLVFHFLMSPRFLLFPFHLSLRFSPSLCHCQFFVLVFFSMFLLFSFHIISFNFCLLFSFPSFLFSLITSLPFFPLPFLHFLLPF